MSDAAVQGPGAHRREAPGDILLINRMMDGVEYKRRAGCNVVVLTKDVIGEEAG